MQIEDFEIFEKSETEQKEELVKVVEKFIKDLKTLKGRKGFDFSLAYEIPEILVDLTEDVDGDVVLYGYIISGFGDNYAKALIVKRVEAYLEKSIFRILDGEKKPNGILNLSQQSWSDDFNFDVKTKSGRKGFVYGKIGLYPKLNDGKVVWVRYLEELTIMTEKREPLVEYNQRFRPEGKNSHEIDLKMHFYENIRLTNGIWATITALDYE